MHLLYQIYNVSSYQTINTFTETPNVFTAQDQMDTTFNVVILDNGDVELDTVPKF